MIDMPLWMTAAFVELLRGTAEAPGPASHPRVASWLAAVGQASDDAIPWCAAFVHAMLGAAGVKGTGSARARSYADWGNAVGPVFGAVCVLRRKGAPGAGHVGFVLDTHAAGVYLLGGNQGDRVSIRGFNLSDLIGYRWPKETV